MVEGKLLQWAMYLLEEYRSKTERGSSCVGKKTRVQKCVYLKCGKGCRFLLRLFTTPFFCLGHMDPVIALLLDTLLSFSPRSNLSHRVFTPLFPHLCGLVEYGSLTLRCKLRRLLEREME